MGIEDKSNHEIKLKEEREEAEKRLNLIEEIDVIMESYKEAWESYKEGLISQDIVSISLESLEKIKSELEEIRKKQSIIFQD